MENSEFEQRRRAVAGALHERKLDALLVSFSPNLRYLSDFPGLHNGSDSPESWVKPHRQQHGQSNS